MELISPHCLNSGSVCSAPHSVNHQKGIIYISSQIPLFIGLFVPTGLPCTVWKCLTCFSQNKTKFSYIVTWDVFLQLILNDLMRLSTPSAGLVFADACMVHRNSCKSWRIFFYNSTHHFTTTYRYQVAKELDYQYQSSLSNLAIWVVYKSVALMFSSATYHHFKLWAVSF